MMSNSVIDIRFNSASINQAASIIKSLINSTNKIAELVDVGQLNPQFPVHTKLSRLPHPAWCYPDHIEMN